MEIITMILSGLALLAAIMCLVLIIRDEKRSEKQRAALLQYVDVKMRDAEVKAEEEENRYRTCIGQEVEKMVDRIQKLEDGITPDYEQAKVAANAVNDFNKSITNILGFDPVAALKADRKREVE